MCKFYVLLARRNHSKGFQKLSLNILKFQKTKYDGVRNSHLSKIVVSQLQCTALLLQL